MKKLLALFLFVLVLCVSQAVAQSGSSARQAPVLRSAATESNASRARGGLVNVPIAVMDRNGRYVANLRQEDFHIFEDGVEQQVAYFSSVAEPFTVALLLDVSGSTQFQLAQIREAANTFVNRLRSNDRLMAVSFDGKIHVLTEPESVASIRQTKLRIPAVTDGTVLYDAVDLAVKRMAQVPGRKAIVLMTDGVDESSSITSQATLAEIAEQDILIYTVQYNTLPQLPQRLSIIKSDKARRKVQERLLKGYAVSEPYLRALADKTGGRFYKADDLRDVGPAFEAITAELGVRYSVGYYPKPNSSGGSEHSVKVRVRYPNLVVRARENFTSAPAIALKK